MVKEGEIMKKDKFIKWLRSNIIILDGAMGSNLQKLGMPPGACTEQWILDNEDKVIELQKAFIEAGADIIYAPTFSANRIKLKAYSLENHIEEINRSIVRLSKAAVEKYKSENNSKKSVYIAGNITMTGEQLYPVGDLMFEELIEVYKEQVNAILKEGVDLFVIETMMSIQETRAAVLAIKETCDLPIMATVTFEANMRTLYGTDSKTALITLQSMGVDAVGINCGTGPEQMLELVKEMKKYAHIPIMVKPNAGMPILVENETVFPMEAKQFSVEVEKLLKAGASIVGGCCGTRPEHIMELKNMARDFDPLEIGTKRVRALTTEHKTFEIDLDGKFMIVGERINPTGKKDLQAELREGKFDIIENMAIEQEEMQANILDINVGMNGIDEKETMLLAMEAVMQSSRLPLCIDSSHVDVIEAALRIYPGRALINSISLDENKTDELITIAKKYGAMFILLPLSSKGMPKDFDEKKEIINIILEKAKGYGLAKEDIIVDGLVNTVAANKLASIEALETIRYCKNELEVATIVGLSNIAFGLPHREFINSTFLAFAIEAGLTMAIANPSQELIMNTILSADLLKNREAADLTYIENVTALSSDTNNIQTTTTISNQNKVYEAVLTGNKKEIITLVDEELGTGIEPSRIIDDFLIPAINEVGDLFDQQKYFLPQLISSANAMREAIDYLEPKIDIKQDKDKSATIVIATVSGDIHDIGKNLVALMLKNYGHNVIDLGKDVPSEEIIEAAKQENADIIALSALMTTTMVEMKKVVSLANEAKLKADIIIGGAVITKGYAKEIGADGYSADAQSAVKLVETLYGNISNHFK